MIPMTPFKTFTHTELVHLLNACAKNLAMAYQATLEEELWMTSERARQASDYLMYKMQKQQKNQTTH